MAIDCRYSSWHRTSPDDVCDVSVAFLPRPLPPGDHPSADTAPPSEEGPAYSTPPAASEEGPTQSSSPAASGENPACSTVRDKVYTQDSPDAVDDVYSSSYSCCC